MWNPKQDILNILPCLSPDDFTRQWGTPRNQWVKKKSSMLGVPEIGLFSPKNGT